MQKLTKENHLLMNSWLIDNKRLIQTIYEDEILIGDENSQKNKSERNVMEKAKSIQSQPSKVGSMELGEIKDEDPSNLEKSESQEDVYSSTNLISENLSKIRKGVTTYRLSALFKSSNTKPSNTIDPEPPTEDQLIKEASKKSTFSLPRKLALMTKNLPLIISLRPMMPPTPKKVPIKKVKYKIFRSFQQTTSPCPSPLKKDLRDQSLEFFEQSKQVRFWREHNEEKVKAKHQALKSELAKLTNFNKCMLKLKEPKRLKYLKTSKFSHIDFRKEMRELVSIVDLYKKEKYSKNRKNRGRESVIKEYENPGDWKSQRIKMTNFVSIRNDIARSRDLTEGNDDNLEVREKVDIWIKQQKIERATEIKGNRIKWNTKIRHERRGNIRLNGIRGQHISNSFG